MTGRVVALVDMDCFYVQVEERDRPDIRGKPAAVVQYNQWMGGGIIAVNYEARAFGVKRGMRGDQARERCRDVNLVTVPVSRGKADLTKYRDAGKEVLDVLADFCDCIERASIDEAYLDLTSVATQRLAAEGAGEVSEVAVEALPSTWVVGQSGDLTDDAKDEREEGLRKWLATLYKKRRRKTEEEEEEEEEEDAMGRSSTPDDLRLAMGAVICEEMRRAVLVRTGFKCSAGIAHNKMLAKLSCGLHKPNQQTILPQGEVAKLWDQMPLGKVRNLGGKLGDSLTTHLSCVTMGDLSRVPQGRLRALYDHKTAHWLHCLGRGIDSEAVSARQLAKSIGCSKNFQGRETLDTPEKVQKWTLSLAEELSERLTADEAANKRCAQTLTVSVRLEGEERVASLTRSCPLPSVDAQRIARVALALFKHTNAAASVDDGVWSPGIKHISLSAGKFRDTGGQGSANIQDMFRHAQAKQGASTPPPPGTPRHSSSSSSSSSSCSSSFFSKTSRTSVSSSSSSSSKIAGSSIPSSSSSSSIRSSFKLSSSSSSSTFLPPFPPPSSPKVPSISSYFSSSSSSSSSSSVSKRRKEEEEEAHPDLLEASTTQSQAQEVGTSQSEERMKRLQPQEVRTSQSQPQEETQSQIELQDAGNSQSEPREVRASQSEDRMSVLDPQEVRASQSEDRMSVLDPQEVRASQSQPQNQPQEAGINQSQPRITTKLTNGGVGKVRVRSGRVSFPSQVSLGSPRGQEARSTNSFFRNFMRKKIGGGGGGGGDDDGDGGD
ncbi:DNA polymerase eta-like, partial [Eriocheir sinensis]|uniref:DNA polymerase eta-like n=1 Tax=Eriocheir sinensis TaxID=95602 RepID=UPI0021C89C06